MALSVRVEQDHPVSDGSAYLERRTGRQLRRQGAQALYHA
jgi:hypothetical protein